MKPKYELEDKEILEFHELYCNAETGRLLEGHDYNEEMIQVEIFEGVNTFIPKTGRWVKIGYV